MFYHNFFCINTEKLIKQVLDMRKNIFSGTKESISYKEFLCVCQFTSIVYVCVCVYLSDLKNFIVIYMTFVHENQ